jgi:hypothetical protein
MGSVRSTTCVRPTIKGSVTSGRVGAVPLHPVSKAIRKVSEPQTLSREISDRWPGTTSHERESRTSVRRRRFSHHADVKDGMEEVACRFEVTCHDAFLGRSAAEQLMRSRQPVLTAGQSIANLDLQYFGVIIQQMAGCHPLRGSSSSGRLRCSTVPGRSQLTCSGNKPGIQRPANPAGNTSCKGPRGPSDESTPASTSEATTRRAWRSPVPTIASVSPRGSALR